MSDIIRDLKLIFFSKKINVPKELTEEEKRKYIKNLYKRKKELHEKLGALKFRELVLKVEKLKFKVMKKIWTNFINHYEKWCDFNTKRLVKNANSKEEADLIEFNNKMAKLKNRKEWNREENRNYHIDNRYPTEIINYLNWNKEVHQKSLKKDIIFISLFGLGTCYSLPLALPLLIISCGSAVVDLECINLQEHSIAEYELCKPALIKKERKDTLKRNSEYIEAKKLIGDITLQNRRILTVEEVIGSIKTKEQAEQIKAWAISMQNKNNSTTISKKKVKN